MAMMPIAGILTDRIGPGKVVLFGLPVLCATLAVLTQVSDATSYWLLGGTLAVMGVGMGATMMPAMSAAYQTLRSGAISRASTTLSIIIEVGGATGTAVMTVLPMKAIATRFGEEAAAGGPDAIPPELREQAASLAAEAFTGTFAWAALRRKRLPGPQR